MEKNLGSLLGPTGRYAKFTNIGDFVKIRVTDFKDGFATKPGGDPELDKNGNPVREVTFFGTTDDGEELRIPAKKGMLYAIFDALRASGADNGDPIDGGTLLVKFVREEPSSVSGWSPRKVYEAAFKPAPKSGLTVDDLL